MIIGRSISSLQSDQHVSAIPAYAKLTKVVEDTLKHSGYPEIDLNKIFADLMVKRGLA